MKCKLVMQTEADPKAVAQAELFGNPVPDHKIYHVDFTIRVEDITSYFIHPLTRQIIVMTHGVSYALVYDPVVVGTLQAHLNSETLADGQPRITKV